VKLPPSAEQGPSRARARDLQIDIDELPEGTRLRARIPGVELEVIALLPEGHERLAVVVPDQCFGDWSGSFRTDDGEIIEFSGIFGWAEEVHIRW